LFKGIVEGALSQSAGEIQKCMLCLCFAPKRYTHMLVQRQQKSPVWFVI